MSEAFEFQFDQLVAALKDALGPSSGLMSDDVDLNHLTKLMEVYDPNEGGWHSYAMGDASRGYTRNLVDEGNGKSNLVRGRSSSAPEITQSTMEGTDNILAHSCLDSRQG